MESSGAVAAETRMARLPKLWRCVQPVLPVL
jgi:hypothetical protein